MDHSTHILFFLFIAFVAAQIGAELALRLKIPSVVGQIIAGCIIGPSGFGLIEINEPLEMLAEIGIIFLLFTVGLETRVEDLKKVGKVAVLVGGLGSLLPFVLGTGWGYALGFNLPKSLFIGSAFVATSVGITARVLSELGVLKTSESRIILGAAVVDDVIAMLILGVVTSLQAGQSTNITSLLLVLLEATIFIVSFLYFGTKIMRKSSRFLDVPIDPFSPLTLSIAGCLGLALLSAYFGLAAIIGAFLAGVVLSETKQQKSLENQFQIVSSFLVPFFFVLTGSKVILSALLSFNALGLLLMATVLATLSKLLGCGVGAISLGKRKALFIGTGMVPRGEVGIIIASLGLQAGIFSNQMYAVIIGMSLLTSILTPPALRYMAQVRT